MTWHFQIHFWPVYCCFVRDNNIIPTGLSISPRIRHLRYFHQHLISLNSIHIIWSFSIDISNSYRYTSQCRHINGDDTFCLGPFLMDRRRLDISCQKKLRFSVSGSSRWETKYMIRQSQLSGSYTTSIWHRTIGIPWIRPRHFCVRRGNWERIDMVHKICWIHFLCSNLWLLIFVFNVFYIL